MMFFPKVVLTAFVVIIGLSLWQDVQHSCEIAVWCAR